MNCMIRKSMPGALPRGGQRFCDKILRKQKLETRAFESIKDANALGNGFGKPCLKLMLWQGANFLAGDLAVLEEQKRRYAPDVIGRRDIRTALDVQLDHLEFAGQTLWTILPRWAQPCGTGRTTPPKSPPEPAYRLPLPLYEMSLLLRLWSPWKPLCLRGIQPLCCSASKETQAKASRCGDRRSQFYCASGKSMPSGLTRGSERFFRHAARRNKNVRRPHSDSIKSG